MAALIEIKRWCMVDLSFLPEVAQELGKLLPQSGVVAIHGAMGAGKTTMVRQLLKGWGATEEGASPTFGLVHHHAILHQGYVQEVRHMDLYRVEDEDEAERSGIAEMLADDALNLVEWPERIPGLMPEDAWLIEIQVEDNQSRTCILSQLRG